MPSSLKMRVAGQSQGGAQSERRRGMTAAVCKRPALSNPIGVSRGSDRGRQLLLHTCCWCL